MYCEYKAICYKIAYMYKAPVALTIKDVRSFILGSHPGSDLKIQYFLASQIAKRAESKGGRALLVGGCVRDALLRRQGKDLVVKDMDMEVYGWQSAELRNMLASLAADPMIKRRLGLKRIQLNEVGRQFGVFNLVGLDIALPRTESRTGPGLGRKPQVISSAELDFEQASRRRDLTINALALDLKRGQVLDAHGGLEDLRKGILRAVDHRSFGDDPLRVLRVMQFAARFEFKIHPGTLSLCRSIDLKHLAKERVGQEWHKMLLWSRKPSIGLQAANKLGIFDKLNPSLAKLYQANKKNRVCLGRAVDYTAGKAALFKAAENKKQLLLLAVMGCVLGRRDASVFLKQINASGAETAGCLSLIGLFDKWRVQSIGQKRPTDLDCAVKKLAFELAAKKPALNLFDFIILLEALTCLDGNNSKKQRQSINEIKSRAESLRVLLKPPAAVLSGRDLLKLGVATGPELGKLLNLVLEEQFKGTFDNLRGRPSKNLALEWIRNRLK